MLTNAWELRNKINACCRQNVPRTDAAMKQDSWATHSTSCENNFFVDFDRQFCCTVISGVLDSVCREVVRRGRVLEQKASDMGIGQDIVVSPVWKRIEISGAAV